MSEDKQKMFDFKNWLKEVVENPPEYKEWSLKGKEHTGWIRVMDDVELGGISLMKDDSLDTRYKVNKEHIEKNEELSYYKKDIDTLYEKLSFDIQTFLHENLNMGWQKNSDISLGIQSIINKRFGVKE